MPEVEEKKPKRGGRKKDEAAKEIEPEAKPKETKAAKKTTKRKAANSEKEDEAPTENAGQEDGDDKAGKPEVKKPKKAKEPKAPAAVSSIKHLALFRNFHGLSDYNFFLSFTGKEDFYQTWS